MSSREGASCAGFTLIELLVVISIIALLISILLPALRQARESGKQLVCLANLKQMYLGINSYGNDNDGYCTPSSIVTTVEPKTGAWLEYPAGSGQYTVLWSQQAAEYMVQGHTYSERDSSGVYGVDPGGKNWPWLCPDGVTDPLVTPYWGNYGLSTYIGGYRWNANPALSFQNIYIKRLAYIKQGATKYLAMDCGSNSAQKNQFLSPSNHQYLPGYNPLSLAMSGGGFTADSINGRHNKTANMLYVDGHAAGEKPNEIPFNDYGWDVPAQGY